MKRVLAGLLLLLTVACGRTHVVHQTQASIVRVTGDGEVCTGFVVAPTLVLTAQHCVRPDILMDGLPALLVQQDQYFDLALYKVLTLTKDPLVLRSTPVIYDEPLIGIGYGFGWSRPLAITFRVIVPNQHVVNEQATGIIMEGTAVGGMSGGPVVDSFGLVVAMNQRTYQGTSYGVSTLIMRAFLLDAAGQ